MLVLVLATDAERYALPVQDVVAVAPLATLHPVPDAPPAVVGLLRHRGRLLPVVDLSIAAGGGPTPRHLSARIVLVDQAGEGVALGLLAPRVLGTRELDPAEVRSDGLVRAGGAWGGVAEDDGGLIRLVAPLELLEPELRAVLVREAAS